MTSEDPPATGDPPSGQAAALVIPVHAERVAVGRRTVATATVKVETVTRTRDQLIQEQLTHEHADIERVPVGRYVDAVPPVRQHGDLTILPVVEEVVVVERKLLLREEVHIRRVRTVERHVETVRLREQQAVVTRTPLGKPNGSPSG